MIPDIIFEKHMYNILDEKDNILLIIRLIF